jgi:hypothetical protein
VSTEVENGLLCPGKIEAIEIEGKVIRAESAESWK